MSKALLDLPSADRSAKLPCLFGSEHYGERAVARADAFVLRLGLTWYKVNFRVSERQPDPTALQPAWWQMARACGVICHVYAKVNGYNPKASRVVIRQQRADAKKAAELQADVDAHVVTLGIAD